MIACFLSHAAGPSLGEEAELRSRSEEQGPGNRRVEMVEMNSEAQREVLVANGEMWIKDVILYVE